MHASTDLVSRCCSALRSPDACLLAVWVTNSIKVQEFVERVLFCSLGATAVARWYWVKLAADGKWTSDPTSAHRKPWEVLLIGYVGGSRQPSPPLPRRLAIVCVPYADQHSAKPSLDALLRQHAAGHLMGDAAVPSKEAWDRLPKCELFARDIKPHWHAYGDEVLRYQHVGWHEKGAECGVGEIPRESTSDETCQMPLSSDAWSTTDKIEFD